jgi:hypothetical protein
MCLRCIVCGAIRECTDPRTQKTINVYLETHDSDAWTPEVRLALLNAWAACDDVCRTETFAKHTIKAVPRINTEKL